MKLRYLLIIPLFMFFPSRMSAQTESEQRYTDSLEYNLHIIKRYLSTGSNWHFTDPLTEKRLYGLIQFIENEPIDTIINHFRQIKKPTGIPLVVRYPEDAPDSLFMPGYISHKQLLSEIASLEAEVKQEYLHRPVMVPVEVIRNAENEVALIPEGLGMQLFTDGVYTLPDSLRVTGGIPDNRIQKPEDFRRILRLDSIRSQYVEQKRLQYNDSLIEAAHRKIAEDYRQMLINERLMFAKTQKMEAVKRNNSQVVKFYNDQAISAVNDSVLQAAGWLSGFADFIDNSTVNLVNLTRSSSSLVLSNAGSFFTRIWLKNQQNDSLSVLIQNIDKHSMQLVIEDQEIFSRFKQDAVNDFDFSSLNRSSAALEKVGKKYQPYTPWTLGGTGNAGFTQTYLNNWKKGGKSSMSILVVMKGYANYSSDRMKWENSAEVRNGWIKPGDGDIQKNDDKLEMTSRLGITAFQKWYYSAEADFETQFFNGYSYPDVSKPVSGFLAPARFMFKIGLDYKPNKNLSLLISPLTSKLVFVGDTLKVDKINFGIDPGKTYYWQPGLNTDFSLKKSLSPEISFETKYKMFINYLAPFTEFDMNWENNLNIKLTNYITMQVMTNAIYDSKVLFDKLDKEGNPVLDSQGKKIREPKLQFKEFFTIGFTYMINHRMVRAREVK